MFYRAPTYNIDTKKWSHTDFEDRKSAVIYIDKQVKYPGRYNLKYTEGTWNEQGKIFEKTGSYPVYIKNSQEYKKHWDFEKEKCKFDGFVIYKSEKENIEFAVPGLMYFYLNYCPILDKVKKGNFLPEIYDGDYHYYLYVLRCILRRKFAVILKKRQSGYTLKNMSIMLNCIWFGKSAVAKIFAYLESKVKDSWIFLENYKEHINKHCAWTRGLDPGQKLDWQIKRKRNDGSVTGNLSIAKGFTTKQDFTNGVGGNADLIFGEEFGINPTGDKTHEYITSNVALGGLTTGLIIYSGAVGELDKAEALKKYILHPETEGFLACENEIEDDIEYGPKVGFFAPEWWNYVSIAEDANGDSFGEALKCFDEWGNSNKELSLSEIKKWRKLAEEKSAEDYRYYISQRPLSIKEAFAFRKDSIFPQNHVQKQMQRIEDKTYPLEFVDLEEDEKGKIKFIRSTKLPITEFPISPKLVNKEGVVVIHERPIAKPELGIHYFGSIDPVAKGATITSNSLCSINIYKRDTEVTRVDKGDPTIEIEPGKLVAWWCGRFDDLNDTHRLLELLIEAYQAWTIVENNVSLFIQYMKSKNKIRYLVPKQQISFSKELTGVQNIHQEYGWNNSGTIFKGNMLNYGIEFLSERIGQETKPDGEIIKVTYGVERIPDIMLLKEMAAYYDGLNVDRLVSYCALIAFVKLQDANRGYVKRVDHISGKEESDPNMYKKQVGFFKNVGNPAFKVPEQYQVKKNLFKNLK